MEVKEEKPMTEQQVLEKTIPVFTVLKNGAILKNIFVVNSRDFSSPERNGDAVSDDGEVEEILLVGRHPDCDILLTHPSISRFHLQIRSVPSRQKLFVTDLSSVHGTWVTDQKVEPDACVEVKEGDVIRIGGSTRIYRLHWIPLSRAYDIENPFVLPLDASTVMEQDEENRMLESENLEVAHQSQADTASGDDGDGHLDVTSEGTGSSVPSEDEDTYITAREILLPLASPSDLTVAGDSVKTQKVQFSEDLQTSTKWDLDVVEAAAEKPSSSCDPSKQESGGYTEVLDCSELGVAAEDDEYDVRGDGGLHLSVMSEMMESSVHNEDEDPYLATKETSSLPIPRDSTETDKLQLTEDIQASPELAIDVIEATSVETDSENLHQKSNELNPAGEQNQRSGMNRETGNIFDEGSSSCFSEDLEQSGIQSFWSLANLKPKTEMSFASERSEDSCKLSEIWSEANTDKEVPFPSTLAAETFEDTKPIEELLSSYTDSQENQTQQPHAVRYDAPSEMDSFSSGKAASVPLLEASGCSAFELASEIEILSPREEVSREIVFGTEQVVESSGEPLSEADIKSHESHEDNGETEVSRQVIVSPSSFPQSEPTLTGDDRGLLRSEVAIEINSENLQQKRNGETNIVSRQASAASDSLFTGNECLSRINTDDIQSLCSSWQPLPESEVEDLSEIWSEVSPAGDQNQISAMNRETEKILDEWRSSCHPEDLKQNGTQSFLLTPNQKPEVEISVGSGISEESYSLSEMESEGNVDKGSPIPSILAAETFEDRIPIEERASDYTGSQENQTPQTQGVRDAVLSELDSSISSSRRLSTSNIWSRRGKAASVLQLRTNKSEGKKKQTGKQPKAQLHRKQVLSAENLEPEIFTPDKENLTPSSHMLKRLQDIGDVKDSKSSSELSGKSCSSIAVLTSGAFTEPEIFTPDKENLTPSSHMLKRLREVGEVKDTKASSSKATRKRFFDIHAEENAMVEQKPDVHFMSSKSKVAPKKKAQRAPFQTLLEKSSSQSQSYTEASSTPSARNNISRGIRSSSNLSDGKNKTKWTIVLDTSSLLDKESRKPLQLLQGLKGTHLVVPRTVLRELNEAKRSRGLLSRRRAETASSALDWIEECMVNTKWWIQLQSSSEETKATAPTPPVTPQSNISPFPFSLHWNNINNNAPEIDSPTSEDQVLECALLYRNRNVDEKLVLLSNDATLKIKAMAEGVICETAYEFYESLKNPFSERFMWTESLPRGRTWSLVDDVVSRERYRNGVAAKGLKLILLHNSHYGHTH